MIPYDLLLYMQLSAGLAWTDEGTGMLNMIAPDKLVSVTRQKEDVMWTNKHGFKHSFAFNLKTKAKGGKLYVRPPQLRISINLLISGTGTILYLIFYHIRVLFKMYSFIGVFLAEHQGFEGFTVGGSGTSRTPTRCGCGSRWRSPTRLRSPTRGTPRRNQLGAGALMKALFDLFFTAQ